MSEIVKASNGALARPTTPEEARVQLAAARARLSLSLDEVKRQLDPFSKWRGVVRKHPVVSVGAAFLVGFAFSQLFSRK